ncbi:LD-carboxypeptidase [Sphingomonas sp. KR1UV-12]|uniref:LD-carboxypeptidase n=1 Tax=Sphingomonas aurea TaxID=3063994 RepID=A0ABT9EKQ4_9SPHN|nr:LD-carboxypeptidase [Sphingomonas sp. KR1UV-12]MDP1027516.1 LD-carboxypeptidase [Sphingomonas sp. KR1UV-12]
MRIGVVAPGRPIDPVVAARAGAFAAIAYPDVDLVFHPQCFESAGHFAGSDAVRAAAFLQVANDPGYDAVWFARGGYGSNRLLAAVMPQLGPAAARKVYAGYSDMGFLLGALYARRIGRPCHAPMATDINRQGGDATVARTLGWIVGGDRQGLEPDLAGRPAAAFNLSILTALIGTPWLPDLTDHVLMIEEVSEPLYRVDRMLFTVANATQLKGIAGIRLGTVNDVQENDPPWAETPEAMIAHWAGDMGVPYLGRARVGHTQDNHVVPFGIA